VAAAAVLPVGQALAEDQVRQVRPDRYLILESLRDGPRWPSLLREIFVPQA
jgi:hypothetical protein